MFYSAHSVVSAWRFSDLEEKKNQGGWSVLQLSYPITAAGLFSLFAYR